jgi:NADH-quinone oxidoreductase subunit J
MLASLAFYLFSTILVGSGLAVVVARNPVHAVLFLILAFFNAAGLFVLMGAEFLAMLLVIVYVGAVAVLFLFVVMMLDIDFAALRRGGLSRYLPLGLGVGGVLLAELVLAVTSLPELTAKGFVPMPDEKLVTNTRALGQILYTQYVYAFQVSGLILLVAMVGAITLTLHHKRGTRRQKIADQVYRTPAETVEIRKVEKGQGVL